MVFKLPLGDCDQICIDCNTNHLLEFVDTNHLLEFV